MSRDSNNPSISPESTLPLPLPLFSLGLIYDIDLLRSVLAISGERPDNASLAILDNYRVINSMRMIVSEGKEGKEL